jgi:hypothetical protein
MENKIVKEKDSQECVIVYIGINRDESKLGLVTTKYGYKYFKDGNWCYYDTNAGEEIDPRFIIKTVDGIFHESRVTKVVEYDSETGEPKP